MHHLLSVSIDWRSKPFPYPPVKRDPIGTYEYIELKGNPEMASSIPEAQDEPACSVRAGQYQQSFHGLLFCWMREVLQRRRNRELRAPIGFLEVCFNSVSLSTNIDAYISLFKRFHASMGEDYNLPVGFEWHLCPTDFLDQEVSGFYVGHVRQSS